MSVQYCNKNLQFPLPDPGVRQRLLAEARVQERMVRERERRSLLVSVGLNGGSWSGGDWCQNDCPLAVKASPGDCRIFSIG